MSWPVGPGRAAPQSPWSIGSSPPACFVTVLFSNLQMRTLTISRRLANQATGSQRSTQQHSCIGLRGTVESNSWVRRRKDR